MMAETKVRRAGALNCFANGERRALEICREAMMYDGAEMCCVVVVVRKRRNVCYVWGRMAEVTVVTD